MGVSHRNLLISGAFNLVGMISLPTVTIKKEKALIPSIAIKQTNKIINAVLSCFGRIMAPWYPMVENTARSMTTEPKTLARPKASGGYRRVTMGVNSKPIICEMTGTDASVSTSWANVVLFFKIYSYKLIKRKVTV